MRTVNILVLISLIIGSIIILSFNTVVAIEPQGANMSGETTTTAPDRIAESHNAYAGNVTEMDVTGYTVTEAWQGYYGNVTGTIELADSGGNVLYNWSEDNPTGEVYAVNYSAQVSWGSIACFDLSADGDQFENEFNISNDAVDGLNETFDLNNHPEFFTAGVQFTIGICNNTRLFNNTGLRDFYEVILTTGSDIIYTSIIQRDRVGFDGATHDFEMMVLEDGQQGDSTATPYYFYLEI